MEGDEGNMMTKRTIWLFIVPWDYNEVANVSDILKSNADSVQHQVSSKILQCLGYPASSDEKHQETEGSRITCGVRLHLTLCQP